MRSIKYFYILSFCFLLANALPKEEKSENSTESSQVIPTNSSDSGVTCPSPLAPLNGYVKGHQYTVGSEIQFMCNEGYFRTGYPMAVCKDDGSWFKNNVSCTARSCGDPGRPLNGRRIGMLFQYHHTVRFSCDKGYFLQGPSWRTCQANQTWSDSQPFCKPISCGEAPNVTLAKMFLYGVGRFVFGNRVEYVCKPGTHRSREGDKTIYCGHDGIWHGGLPVCKDGCPQPKSLSNGNIQINNKTEGAIVQYTCNPGYTLFGSHWRKCLKTGRWTGPEPICFECAGVGTQVFIRKGYHFKHGSVKSKSGKQVSVYYREEDDEEDITIVGLGTQHYIIVQDRIPSKDEIFILTRVLAVHSRNRKYMFATVRSINGDLFGVQFDGEGYGREVLPLDEIRTLEPPRFCSTCSDPGSPMFSSREDSLTEFIPGMEVIYTCEYTHKMTGSQTRQCQKDGTWTGMTPRCTVDSCDELDAFPPRHGQRKGKSFTIGSTLEFSCDDSYTLAGQSKLTCTHNGSWSYPAPICRSVCENFQCSTVGQKCQYIKGVGPRCVCRENKDCRALYEPVCGSDGQGYNSHCIMSARACRTRKTITMVRVGRCLPGGLCQIVPYSVCRGYFPRYFYNSTSQKCQYFIAGGCHPSGFNGFQTEQKCNQACLGDICKQRITSGPCSQKIAHWAFDSSTGRCRRFNYGGCFGNENNFISKELCLKRCRSKKVAARMSSSCPNCVRVKLHQACQDSVLAILAKVVSILPNDEEQHLHRYLMEIHSVFKDTSGNITEKNSIVSVPYQSPSKCSCLRIPKHKKFVLIGRMNTNVTTDHKTGLILNSQSFTAGWSEKIRKQIRKKCGKQLTVPFDIL